MKIANYWQKVAEQANTARIDYCRKETIEKIKITFPKSSWDFKIKEAKSEVSSAHGLEYLEGEHMFGYFIDSIFAHFYASSIEN